MPNSNFRRVSRNRCCRICGKPDWCSYTPDEKVSFCARVIERADRVSRTGWGVFFHEKSLFPFAPLPLPRRAPTKRKAELAPLEIRDFAYRKLIELAPATDFKEIIDGEKGLRARKILDFENYGALPQTQSERRELAKIVRNAVNREFADYARTRRRAASAGLPGFWFDENGSIRLWTEKNYAFPLMLIPYRDEMGLIQACQIRFMGSDLTDNHPRYVWLSTPEKSNGIGCGSPLHFARPNFKSFGKPVLVTEGALKAETAQIIKQNFDVIASGGVNCSHDEIVAATRLRSLFLAFDSDCAENPFVARAVARLIALRFADGAKYGYNSRIEILTWEAQTKGIDDALLKKIPVRSVLFADWFASLSEICRNEIEVFFERQSEKVQLRDLIAAA